MTTMFRIIRPDGTIYREVSAGPDVMEACDQLFRKEGIRPRVERMEVASESESAPEPTPAPVSIQESETPSPDNVSASGRARSLRDIAAAEAAGFTMASPMYARGTRVNSIGVENARTSRLEWEALHTAKQVHLDLAREVQKENRRNFVIPASSILLREDGKLTTTKSPKKGLSMAEGAFKKMIYRLGIPNGAAYLSYCPPWLRAENVNHWVGVLRREEET